MRKKIAVLVTDDFEDSEYTAPVNAYEQAGFEAVNIEKEAGKTVKGKAEGTPVTIDLGIDDAQIEDYAALLLPGGHSPDKLRGDDRFPAFVQRFVASGKPVFSICHGPQLLISAGVVKGRKLTAVKNIAIDLKNAGAIFEDSAVVVDGGQLVSSRVPDDLPQFIEASLKLLKA